MKILNLNKIIILSALFLSAIAFSNSANALCVVNGDGAIVIADEVVIQKLPLKMILQEMPITIQRIQLQVTAILHLISTN